MADQMTQQQSPVADRPSRTARESQADFIATLRRTSCIDHAVPLGVWPSAASRPESGPSAFTYYRDKHARGECGRFYPVHQLCAWNTKQYQAGKVH
jgi:hypothetical protein